MINQYYLAEAFEYHLRLLKHREQDVMRISETPSSTVSGASILLTRLIAEAKVIDVTTLRRKTLWINEARARKLTDAHSKVFPASLPKVEYWVSAEVLEPFKWKGTDGFWIKSNEGSSAKALALYWEELLTDSSIGDPNVKFESWLEKADCLPHSGFEAPALMTTTGKEQYLTTALEWVEKNRSVDTPDYGTRPPPPVDSNPIEFFMWGDSIEVQRDRPHGFESENVEMLICQIVKFDSRQAGYEQRCLRIRSLLKSGVASVVCATSEVIHRLNPQAFAWILSDPKTLSLGLALIESASMSEPFAWQAMNGESREIQQEEFRFNLWSKAVEIVSATFSHTTDKWNSLSKAISLWEILRFFAQREEVVDRQISFRPDVGKPRKVAINRRRRHLVDELGVTRSITRIHDGKRVFSPRVLNEFADDLVRLCSKRQPPERENFESMPYAEIETLLWVINEITKDPSEKEPIVHLIPVICESLTRLYSDELGREFYSDKNYRVTWTSEADLWSGYDWIPTVEALYKSNQIQSFLSPVDFKEAISLLPDVEGRELYEIQSDQRVT